MPTPAHSASTAKTRQTGLTMPALHLALQDALGARSEVVWLNLLKAARLNPARTDDAAVRQMVDAMCASPDDDVASCGRSLLSGQAG